MKTWLHRLFGMAKTRPELPVTSAAVPAPAPAMLPGSIVAAIDVDEVFYPWLLGIVPDGDEPNEAEKRFLRALERMSSAEGATVTELVPRMPAVIPMLLQSLRDKNISNAQLSATIAQDAVLVAAVLRQVNSSWYRRTSAVTSIEQALTILGQNGLRLLVASVAFRPVLSAQSGHFTKLAASHIGDLSGKCTVACRCLALHKHVDPFEPFLAALTQHVGLLVALRVMDQVYDGNGTVHSAAFCKLLAHHAHLLSRHVALHWNFPETVIEALGEDGRGSAIGEMLHLGDRLSKIHLLVDHGRMTATEAACCLADDDALACYLELNAGEADAASA